MLESVLGNLLKVKLIYACSRSDIPTEYAGTMKISDWKNYKPDLDNRPAVFSIQ
jgi:hypothetical protein